MSRISGAIHTSITGQPITGDSMHLIEQYLLDETYPLRFHLDSMQLELIIRLMYRDLLTTPESRRWPDFSYVISAAGHLRDELHTVLDEFDDAERTYRRSLDNLPDNADANESERTDGFGVARDTYASSQMRCWAIRHDPQDAFECIYDTSDLLDSISPWTWGDVAGILALWCIDEAATYLNSHQPYKAAAWAIIAERYSGWQASYSPHISSNPDSQSIVGSLFSAQGLAIRHAKNRAVKAQAIQTFESRSWRSQAEAARKISTQVNRTEKVVEKWLREYRKTKNEP